MTKPNLDERLEHFAETLVFWTLRIVLVLVAAFGLLAAFYLLVT